MLTFGFNGAIFILEVYIWVMCRLITQVFYLEVMGALIIRIFWMN